MIEVKNLCKIFGELEVLNDISFSVKKNESLCILGPNGCGKTTLVKILAGILPFDSGKIRIDGKIGIMFQEERLLPWRTVEENIALGRELQNMGRNQEKIDDLLELTDLKKFSSNFPHHISKGMKQKAALVRTLAIEPAILLLDEPFSSLDVVTRKKLQNKFLEICEKQKLISVFITHDVNEALKMGKKIMILSERPAKIKKIITNKNKDKTRKKIEETYFL